MSETSAGEKKDVGADREWESVVRRISDRIRSAPGSAGPSTTASTDLAQELATLERRALEAEGTLVRERDAYSIRVREMEDKLRKLEPWLRRLRQEFQDASQQRDKLQARLDEMEKGAGAGPARSPEQDAALRAEREVALREAEAAKAARDAALAEAASLRTRLENDLRTLQESWKQRIDTAEASRDKALDEVKGLRTQLGAQRRADEEIKRLLKEKEALETTTAAHKAVARAAQEEAEGVRQKLADAEKQAGRAGDEAKGWIVRADDLAKKLEAAQSELDRFRDENRAIQVHVANAESAIKELRAENDRVRHELSERERSLGGARAESEALKKTLEKLRTEISEARSAAERSVADASSARREVEAQARENERLKSESGAERKKAAEELARIRHEAADAKELAEEAMRAEEQARRAGHETAERLQAETKAREEAQARAADFEGRFDHAQIEAADARRTIEEVRGTVSALEVEKANLVRSLDEERHGAAKRFEAAETSWRSQLRAVEGRFEADLHKERQRAADLEDASRIADRRHAEEIARRDVEIAQLKAGVAEFVRRKAQELVDGIALVAGGLPDVSVPVAAEELCPPPTVEVTVAMSESLRNAAPPVVPALDVAPAADAAADAEPDWDRLLSDVQALRSEVEGLRADPVDDTASISVEEAPAAVPEPDDQSNTCTVEPEGAPGVTDTSASAHANDNTDTRNGRRRRRR